MRSTTYQGTGTRLLLGVATMQDQAEDEDAIMDSTEHDWTELREAVAKALGCEVKDVTPRQG